MPRYRFEEGQTRIARLLTVVERPIENHDRGLAVLRLEFEIFSCDPHQRRLESTGQIASRDLVVGLRAVSDGVMKYAQALGVAEASSLAAWQRRARPNVWVSITFGPADPRDGRNEFKKIHPFSTEVYDIREFNVDLAKNWVASGEAAKAMGVSEASVRRLTKKYLAEYGSALERRTEGGHRRINLLLLRHIIDDPGWLDAVRIAGAQRVRELERKNAELQRMLAARRH